MNTRYTHTFYVYMVDAGWCVRASWSKRKLLIITTMAQFSVFKANNSLLNCQNKQQVQQKHLTKTSKW